MRHERDPMVTWLDRPKPPRRPLHERLFFTGLGLFILAALLATGGAFGIILSWLAEPT